VRGSTPVETNNQLEAEDLARARWYSFFSRWFLAAPDQQALDMFIRPAGGGRHADAVAEHVARAAQSPQLDLDPAGSSAATSWLESAWAAFTGVVTAGSIAQIRQSYDDTFISVGEAPVSLHASVYLTGFSNERPLAEVRQWLAARGIQGSREGLVIEDHLGLLCEAMAWLIIGGDEDEAGAGGTPLRGSDEDQKYLFQHFIAPVCDEFCQRLSEAPAAGIYRELGHLFAAFCAVERQAFDIER
jgi:TorA maturation chaperone TorD